MKKKRQTKKLLKVNRNTEEDNYKLQREEIELVERTATSAAEIDFFKRGNKNTAICKKQNEEAIKIAENFIKEKISMKEHKVVFGRIQLLKTQLRSLMQACEQAVCKFDDDLFMSSTIPYTFNVTEKDIRFNLNLIEYRYLSVKDTLVDIKDEVVTSGTEVKYER